MDDIEMSVGGGPAGLEIELNDGRLHLRLDVTEDEGARILENINQVCKGFKPADRTVTGRGVAVEVWNADGRKPPKVYGVRVAGHGVTITGRVADDPLLDFADDLEERVG